MKGNGTAIANYPLQRYLHDAQRGKQRDYLERVHQVRFAPTALNTEVTDSSQIEPAEPFLWTHTVGFAFDQATGLQVTPNALIVIRMGGSGGRSFSRSASHWINRVGEQTMPFREMVAMPLNGGTSLHVTLTLLTGVLTMKLAICFLGVRLRKGGVV